ncbi:sigma-70 family RNA polymerase sigma factor [Blastopirellula marina]|uniref:RNA polymerase sigma-70 ECF-like HTH domain-containing protein n=1 Tax=Blastopirellula marina DSM 3645 TaxID=314230 RepID=A3ZQ02_9BACT|nr:sigma-70 family RNA polymerase sigma factor [Blastopirellula marina]EAQ81275.1 hypothetical protein DSM3645_22826 [Blastopirellula marina DSM 3645]
MSDFTEIMNSIDPDDPQAAERLMPLVYDELRKLAAAYLAREQPGQTLQATALVNEAYLRLVGHNGEPVWKNKGHFFGAAALAIRRILVDNARRKKSRKRGGGAVRHDLYDEMSWTLPEPVEDLLALDEALYKLSDIKPQAAELVQLVYFSGLTRSQAAEAMGISTRSADRLWAYSKAWLRREIRGSNDNS